MELQAVVELYISETCNAVCGEYWGGACCTDCHNVWDCCIDCHNVWACCTNCHNVWDCCTDCHNVWGSCIDCYNVWDNGTKCFVCMHDPITMLK